MSEAEPISDEQLDEMRKRFPINLVKALREYDKGVLPKISEKEYEEHRKQFFGLKVPDPYAIVEENAVNQSYATLVDDERQDKKLRNEPGDVSIE